MNGSHVAGGGLGALLGIILASLGSKVGLHLDDATAALLGTGCVAVGLAVGHAFGKAWSGPGVFPALHRGFYGPKQPETPQEEPAA
jgi:hypothetical protein